MTKLSAPAYASVSMPKSNVSCKKSGYVYHIGKGYRNDKGQPTSPQTIIGKYDAESDMLIPNDNYFRLYGGKPQPRAAAKPMVRRSRVRVMIWALVM